MIYQFFNPYPDSTSKMLGLSHILILLFGMTFVIYLAVVLKRDDEKDKRRIYKILAIIGCLMDPIFYIWEYTVTKKINVSTSLPLYFCSTFFITATVYAFTKKESKIHHIAETYLCTMNIICAALGLIFLVYFDRYPTFHFVIVRSVFYHFLMILFPMIICLNKDYKYKRKDFILFIIPALFIFIPAFILDLIYGWDYCYFNGGKGTPVNLFVGKLHPFLRLIAITTFFIVLTNLCFFLPIHIKRINNKKKTQLMNQD